MIIQTLSTNPFKTVPAITVQALSPLEMLPPEILTEIFLEDVRNNISLPSASHVISAKLGCVLEKVVIDAFDPCWQLWYGVKTSAAWYWSKSLCRIQEKKLISENFIQGVDYGLNLRPGEGGDIKWQSIILNQPWASLALLLVAKETWIRNHASDRRYVSFAHEFERFQSLIDTTSPDRLFGDPPLLEAHFETSIEIKRGVDIPDRVLVGPWTEGNTKHLFWLIKSGARSMSDYPFTHGHCYEDRGSRSWFAYTGWKSAVRAGNLAVLCLLRLLIKTDDWMRLVDCSELFWAIRNAGGDRTRTIDFVMHLAPSETTRSKVFQILDDPSGGDGIVANEQTSSAEVSSR